ncbi:MAG: hypothetical protein WBV94_27425 [Blastocatellia bacterium]
MESYSAFYACLRIPAHIITTDNGILGDKFLVNGKIQPIFHVRPRRYRLRWLNSGLSRFYQFFFTDPTNLNRVIPF